MISDFDAFQASAIVEKTSKTGLSSNKRVLAISKGVLYYYSNVPKDFKPNHTEALINMKEAPKCSIEVRFLTGISQDVKKPSEVTIKFAAYHAIEREEFKLRTSLVPSEELNLNTGKTSEIVSWTFKFQTQQLARWWLISLEQLKGHYEKNNDDENLERFLESFNADKKKANYARRQSNLDSLPKGSSPTNAGYRNTTLPQGLKGIDEVDEGNPQEEEISRQVKLREDKMKRQMEEKFKKEMQARIAQEARQKEALLIEKELERQRVEVEKRTLIEEKEKELKKIEAELNAKLEHEMELIRKMEEEKQLRLEAQRNRLAEEQRVQRQLETKRRQEEIQARQRESEANRLKIREAELSLKKSFDSSMAPQQQSSNKYSAEQPHNTQQPFRVYLDLLNGLFCENMQERLHRQTQLMKFVVGCKLEAFSLVRSLVDELELPPEQRRYHPTKNCYSTGKLTVELAFCSTTSININGKFQVLYDESLFNALEAKIQACNQLNNRIMQVMKKRQYFPLRLPLMFLLEYRGVGALVTLNDYIESGEPLQQSEEQLYEKELTTLLPTTNTEMFRPVPVDLLGQRLMVLEPIGKVGFELTTQLEFHFPILPKDFVRYNSKIITPERVKKTKQRIPRNPTHSDKEKIECLNSLEFCLNVRKLYRAGQGQLKDSELWRMVLNEDPSIVGMMGEDLCRSYPQKGLIIEYLREICGVEITLSSHWKPYDLKKIESAVPLSVTRQFNFEQLEVVELSENIEKYIKEGKERLIQLALSYQKALYGIEPNNCGPYIINQLSSLYREKFYDTCAKQCQLLLDSVPVTHTIRLKCYEILLGCYRHLQNHEMFMSSYKNMLEYVQFVFGDVSYMIKLCCLLGQYLKSRGNAQEALEVYEEAVRLAQKLENKDEEVSLYIDMNNIHLESINASDARNILQFCLAELEGKGQRQDITAKLNQHLAKLYHLVGEDEVALRKEALALQYYELSPAKYHLEILQGYTLQLRLINLQEQKQVAAKMVQLAVATGDHQPLSRLIEFVFTRLIRKLSSKALTDLGEGLKALSIGEPTSEQFILRLTKRSPASDKSVIDYLTNLYVAFLSNRTDTTICREFGEAVKLVGRDALLKLTATTV